MGTRGCINSDSSFCEYRFFTSDGKPHCRSNDECIKKTGSAPEGIITVFGFEEEPQVGTTCAICGNFISFSFGNDYRVCNECRRRLKRLLYPENSN